MSWNGAGVYTRGYASWSNDAASNLPISATKFDLEDNDFAGGINNALCKDGQNSPTAALTWTIANAAPLTLLRQTDGTVLGVGRANGTNNPVLQVQLNDGQGATLNLTTAQQISFAIQGTSLLTLTSAGVTTVAAAGTAAAPSYGFQGSSAGMYASATNALDFSTSGVQRMDISSNGAVTINQAGGASVGLTIVAANGTQGLSVAGFTLNQGISISSGFAELLSSNTTSTYIGTKVNGPLVLCTNSVGYITLDASGHVAFGAPSSGDNITVAANVSQGIQVNATDLPRIAVTANSTVTVSMRAYNGGTEGLIGTQTNHNLNLRTNDVDRVIIDTAGNINVPNGTGALSPVYAGIPQNVQTGSYSIVLADANKHIFNNSGGTHTYTIPANASVAFPIGTAITFITGGGSGVVTLSITSDTLAFYPSAATGSRTLAPNSSATIIKVLPTVWILTGVGVS